MWRGVLMVFAICLAWQLAAAEPRQPKQKRCDGVHVKIGRTNETQCIRPGSGKTEWFKDCADCPDMVVVPAGSFMMGSPKSEAERSEDEGPRHTVRIGGPFAVGRFEVTRVQFETFVEATGHYIGSSCWTCEKDKWKLRTGRSFGKPGFAQDSSHPAVCVNWHDAKAYAAWVSKKTGKRYRLLSEAEWEYAARAGTTTRYSWGDEVGKGNANCHDCGSQWDSKKTAPVGSFKPNAFGLHDMHGNVWEWVADCWNKTYEGAPKDGLPWTSGDCSSPVLRGGSWLKVARLLRSANRTWLMTVSRFNYNGFRVARTL